MSSTPYQSDIEIDSRHGDAKEMAELQDFVAVCVRDEIDTLVISAYYDSVSQCCQIAMRPDVVPGSVQAAFILDAALETISQFEFFGVVQHGRGAPEEE